MERIKIPKHLIAFIITTVLFLIPFFWFKPGQMDLGGDSSRLYFYQPFEYLKNYSLFGISPSNFGEENIGYFSVPFVFLLGLLQKFLFSPTILIAAFHGLSLAVAFLSCYFIIITFFDKEENNVVTTISGIVTGVIYLFSQPVIYGWDKVLITHNQVFLNPFIFLLLLRYFRTINVRYLLVVLITTFIFSPNFSFVAAPPIFSFYPVSILFLLLYRRFILKKTIIWKHIVLTFFAFLLLQSFHIFPQIISMFTKNSVLNQTIFTDRGKFDRGLSYFIAIASNIKVSLNLLGLIQSQKTQWYSWINFIFPAVIFLAFYKNKSKLLLLTGLIFFIVLFFASANITGLGFFVYKEMFKIPGFSMFRNFYGQWEYTYFFFYAILIGQSLFILSDFLSKRKLTIASCIICFLLLIQAWPFITGNIVNISLWQSKNMHIFITPEKSFTQAIDFIKSMPSDGKFLTLPLTDPGYQQIAGIDNSIYQGPSFISYLGGKQDFAGLLEFADYKDEFINAVRQNNTTGILRILGILNIKYIFYDSDKRVYDTYFSGFPYIDVRDVLPTDQKSYAKFLSSLPLKELATFGGKYHIYEIKNTYYAPTIFTTTDENYYATKINTLTLPLTFKNVSNVIFSETLPSEDLSFNTISQLQPTDFYFQFLKNPKEPIILEHSFAKTSPEEWYYPLIILKENMAFRKVIPDTNTFLDKKMFLAAKRLDEMERWRNDIPVQYSFTSFKQLNTWYIQSKTKPVWDSSYWNIYKTFEGVLSRYIENIDETIQRVNQTQDTNIYSQKFLINEYLIDHRRRFTNLIDGMHQGDDIKSKLDKLVDNIFDHFAKSLQLPQLDIAKENLVDNGIWNRTTAFYIEKVPYESTKNNTVTVLSGSNTSVLYPSVDQTEDNWLSISNLPTISQNKEIQIFSQDYQNILDSSSLVTMSNNDAGISLKDGLLWKITNWQPRGYYLLSFEYNTKGKPYTVKIIENKKFQNRSVQDTIVDNQIKSRDWQHYQALIRADQDTNFSYVQLVNESLTSPNNILMIKNYSFNYLPDPMMLHLEDHSKKLVTPSISIKKMNPTRYMVHVSNIQNPFVLVLNQSFADRWILTEGVDNANDIFSPIKKIFGHISSPANHFVANGYANAWYINPHNFSNKENNTFTIEFSTQWYFYLGMYISLLTVASVIAFFLYLLLRKK